MKAMLAALMVLALPMTAAAQSPNWTRYNLGQGSAAVDLPAGLFERDLGPTKNGAGHTFATFDGRADLSLYALPNRAGRTPAEFMAEEFRLPLASATYRRISANMLAVSGFRGDQIFYVRCNFGRRDLHCVSLNYPAREKRNWDAAVTRISHSLSRAG
jgi:hypothetical protein